MRTNFTGDGSEFVFVDEVSKNEITWARQYGRAMAGRRAALTDVFVRGDRYSLVAAITTEGYMAAHVIEGSFDNETFYEFITTKVVSANPHFFTCILSWFLASIHEPIPHVCVDIQHSEEDSMSIEADTHKVPGQFTDYQRGADCAHPWTP